MQPQLTMTNAAAADKHSRAVQAMRRSAERAFLELGLRDMARIDGWVLVDQDQMASNRMADVVLRAAHKVWLDPGPEDGEPGEGPLERERPWMLHGDISDVCSESLAPT